MPVLRPAGHADQQRARWQLALAQQGVTGNVITQEPLRWAVGWGLELELVYDSGKTMRPLSMFDAAGSAAAELKKVALANLFAASGGGLPVKDGAWIADWRDGFAASRLLLPWSALHWADEPAPRPLLALTPLYDSFLVAPADDATALERIMREAEEAIDGAGDGWRSMLTAKPWRLEGDTWVPCELAADHPLAPRVAKLEAAIAAARVASFDPSRATARA
jgi:hypothetical protein